MVAKLGFIVDGSGWDPANIIGSIYPQPTVANIGLLNADGITMLAGAAPTQIGSPVMGAGYQTLNGYNAGYDTGIADTITKTIMFLGKPVVSGTKRSVGIGSYHGGNGTPPVPQGDTFVIDPTALTLRAIGSTSTGSAQSQLDNTALDLTKFQLYIADFTASTVQVGVFKNGALVSGPVSAATGRSIPTSNLRIGVGYDIQVVAGGLDGPVQIAAWGIWSGVNLSATEKSSIYSTLKNMLGSVISIS